MTTEIITRSVESVELKIELSSSDIAAIMLLLERGKEVSELHDDKVCTSASDYLLRVLRTVC